MSGEGSGVSGDGSGVCVDGDDGGGVSGDSTSHQMHSTP